MQNSNSLSFNIKLLLLIVVSLWASAFVGIRAGLESYSPGGLALLRFGIASVLMFFVYVFRQRETQIAFLDGIKLMSIGALGIGFYNIALNYGELSVPSGPACFIVSQSPIITTILALIFLNERLTAWSICGMLISFIGVVLITYGMSHGFQVGIGVLDVAIATVLGSCYSIMQKPLLKKYHALDATAYMIWGGTLVLLFYSPHLPYEIYHASWHATIAVIYLGVFPAALAYMLWSYVLAKIPATQATSFLYFSPIVATLLGWIWLNEVPAMISLVGGLVALLGVWVVNRAYVKI